MHLEYAIEWSVRRGVILVEKTELKHLQQDCIQKLPIHGRLVEQLVPKCRNVRALRSDTTLIPEKVGAMMEDLGKRIFGQNETLLRGDAITGLKVKVGEETLSLRESKLGLISMGKILLEKLHMDLIKLRTKLGIYKGKKCLSLSQAETVVCIFICFQRLHVQICSLS